MINMPNLSQILKMKLSAVLFILVYNPSDQIHKRGARNRHVVIDPAQL
jgi:hypothetical protein